ncbi:hypothetical protein ACWD8L_00830 [Streptomyces sp. NPDC005133]
MAPPIVGCTPYRHQLRHLAEQLPQADIYAFPAAGNKLSEQLRKEISDTLGMFRAQRAVSDAVDREAIDTLYKAQGAAAEGMRFLLAGFLASDNFRVRHGRSPITSLWDGGGQRLHRGCVRADRNGQLSGGGEPGDPVPCARPPPRVGHSALIRLLASDADLSIPESPMVAVTRIGPVPYALHTK